MKCDRCGNVATTKIRTVVNGVAVEKNLCDSCASMEGYSITPQTGLAGVLASMFGDALSTGVVEKKSCSVCGATFNDIANSGKVGCAECYKTFKNDLVPYLKRVHGSVKHIGKISDKNQLGEINEETIDSLREELKELISEENYEQAAVVRDKIKKLEAGE